MEEAPCDPFAGLVFNGIQRETFSPKALTRKRHTTTGSGIAQTISGTLRLIAAAAGKASLSVLRSRSDAPQTRSSCSACESWLTVTAEEAQASHAHRLSCS
ncbi:hypothetical protein Q8A67_024931 [Cirrhinus molitorella]|uniref:Uncharacterized protein n=1 Tax=Cirrhinus molitorella TaxID=172907 RepID=A0AA88P6Z0_9TELE|nr:hypothetical protein Q8A67_024931 [Cirrhinus molitorella]